ncbi:Chloroplastic lipocalin [Bienertia sinuspersici]
MANSPIGTGGNPENLVVRCSIERPASENVISKQIFSGLIASCIFFSQPNLVYGADVPAQNSVCQLASSSSNEIPFPLDENSSDPNQGAMMMMMRAMTAKNFDPVRYAGRWFEVASLKRGFAGQGQEDCHCTQGVYTFDMAVPAIQVDTFCVHGGPDGYITGIRGKVQLIWRDRDDQREVLPAFPTLPFIPKEPYDVIATDYDNYALVSGAKDRSFIQIYSRTPNPGPEFIEKYKTYLADFGYDPNDIKDTPQDCQVMSNSQLAAMMNQSEMQQALNNQFPDLGLKSSVAFDPFTSVTETLKKLLELTSRSSLRSLCDDVSGM